jgi:argininosuccinate synthase
MKNLALVVAIAFTIILQTTSCKKDKNDPPTIPQNIYQSSLTNPSLEELQAFYDAGYDIINGNVELTGIVGLLNMQLLSMLYATELG